MGDVGESAESPILNFEGELVALGPLRRDLLPLYQRPTTTPAPRAPWISHRTP
jgi:hypothetical protein